MNNPGCASGGANDMRPETWGGGGWYKEKRSQIFTFLGQMWLHLVVATFLVAKIGCRYPWIG